VEKQPIPINQLHMAYCSVCFERRICHQYFVVNVVQTLGSLPASPTLINVFVGATAQHDAILLAKRIPVGRLFTDNQTIRLEQVSLMHHDMGKAKKGKAVPVLK
jgi:hypothetical protein